MTSVEAFGDHIYAASFDRGVYRKTQGTWTPDHDGLPEGTVVNRFRVVDERLYACTNRGLFAYDNGGWQATGIDFPCYQLIKRGRFLTAATEYGLWCSAGRQWHSIAYRSIVVFDLWMTPEYIYMATSGGIAMYDLLTDEWAEFPMHTAVTGLASGQGALLGISADGRFVLGNKRGGFEFIRYEGLTFNALKQTASGLLACTNRGLYRVEIWAGRLMLRALLTGYRVTDVNLSGNSLYLATLNRGLQLAVR